MDNSGTILYTNDGEPNRTLTHTGFSNDPRVDFYKRIIIHIKEF